MIQWFRPRLAGRAFSALVLGLLLLRSTVAGACAVQDLCVAGDHGPAAAALVASVDAADVALPALALSAPAGATDLESPCHCDCSHTPTALPAALALPSPAAAAEAVAPRVAAHPPASIARVLRPPIA